jgi:hypothetical protein
LGIAYFFFADAFLAGAFFADAFFAGLLTRLGACFSHNDLDIVFLSER